MVCQIGVRLHNQRKTEKVLPKEKKLFTEEKIAKEKFENRTTRIVQILFIELVELKTVN